MGHSLWPCHSGHRSRKNAKVKACLSHNQVLKATYPDPLELTPCPLCSEPCALLQSPKQKEAAMLQETEAGTACEDRPELEKNLQIPTTAPSLCTDQRTCWK